MATGQRVLVIDGQSETEEVLRAVLEPRGLQVQRVRGNCSHAWDDEPAPPSVLVLHEDSPQPRGGHWSGVPRVIIGSLRVPAPEVTSTLTADLDQRHLAKPFHYGELVSAIEQLLARPAPSM